MSKQDISQSAIDAFFAELPRRYFITHTPKQIARHAEVVLHHAEDRVPATAFREMRGGFTEFILCTADAHGLYSDVAGTLSAHSFNILGSNVYTTRTGLALEIYRLGSPPGGPEEREMAWRGFEQSLLGVLAGELSVESIVRGSSRPIGMTRPPARKSPRVIVSNEESEFYTLVDVIADDRIGLLYDVTRCLGENGLEIYISKAATIKDQVTDSFYLKGPDGRKVRDEESLSLLRERLLIAARGESPDEEEDQPREGGV